MLDRTLNRYAVQLQRSDGEIMEGELCETYWDPTDEDHAERAAAACAAQTTVFKGGQVINGHRQYAYQPITAVLQEA